MAKIVQKKHKLRVAQVSAKAAAVAPINTTKAIRHLDIDAVFHF